MECLLEDDQAIVNELIRLDLAVIESQLPALIDLALYKWALAHKNAQVQLSRTMWASIKTLFAGLLERCLLYILLRPRSNKSSY